MGTGENMRKILFFLILFFLTGHASAWEATFEGHWYDIPSSTYSDLPMADFQNETALRGRPSIWAYETILQNFTGYLVYDTYFISTDGKTRITLIDSSDTERYTFSSQSVSGGIHHKVEIVESPDATKAVIYIDGVAKQALTRSNTSLITKIKVGIYEGGYPGYIPEISTSPYCITQKGLYSSLDAYAYFTAIAPVTAGYNYSLHLTNSNGVSLYSKNITDGRTQFYISPMVDLKVDGIYYSEIYGQDGILYYSKPFFFFAGGIYPDNYFVVTTDTAADIRDENNNGGEVTGGGTVYLDPTTKTDGYYNFTCSFSEAAYSRKVSFQKTYNESSINGSVFLFSGIQGMTYNVSVDNALVAQTSGSNTWNYDVNWIGDNSYDISFEPDYSLPGVWGYAKSSVTQNGLQSASVTISNSTFSTTIRTDINGMYYLTDGIIAGETYTIQVSKIGYDKPAASSFTTQSGLTTRKDFSLDPSLSPYPSTGSGIYYAPHDVSFKVLEHWYSGAGLTGVSYAIYNGTESLKTGSTDSKGMFTGSDMTGGTNYTIVLTHNGKTYTEYVEPSLTEYTIVLNKEGILHQYANPWLTLSYTENTNNVTIAYNSNKTITGASLTVIAGNGTIVYTQTLNTTSGSFLFETGGEGDYTLNFHIQAADGSTASQSWGLSYPDKIPLFPDSYPAWLKNILFSGIVMVFLLAFGKSKNDIACGAVAILTSMGYLFGWFTGSYYFVVLVWIIALGAVFLHYKRTGGIG